MKRTLLVLAIVGLACSQAQAVRITLFSDVDTFVEQAKDIVIAKCVSVPEEGPGTFRDGLFPVTVEVISNLKGTKKPETIATIYEMQPGTTYLLASSGGMVFDTDFLALPELSVVPIPADFDLKKLKGKDVKQQVQLIMARHLFEIERKLAPLKETERLLHQALQDRRDDIYDSAGDVQLGEIRTVVTNKIAALDLPAGRLQWSQSSPGKSGYFYFRDHGDDAPEWEFAASDVRDIKAFAGKPLLVKFYGHYSPSLDKRLGPEASNAIRVEVGQIVLARTAKDPTTIYILKIDKQEQAEAMTVQYAILSGE